MARASQPGCPFIISALALASIVCGPARGKAIKGRWDKRKDFYPTPVQIGQDGLPHLYNPRELLRAASVHGDLTAREIIEAEAALRILCGNGVSAVDSVRK